MGAETAQQQGRAREGEGNGAQQARAWNFIGHLSMSPVLNLNNRAGVDQDAAPRGGIGHPVGQRRMGGGVVGNLAVLGVRPVAAPHQAIGAEGLQQRLGGVVCGDGFGGRGPVAVGGRELDPDAPAGRGIEQPGKAFIGTCGRRCGPAEVVHHQRAAGVEHGLRGQRQVARFAVQLHMPVQCAHAGEELPPVGLREIGQRHAHEVEADAADTGGGHRLQRGVVHPGVDHGNAAQARRAGTQRVDQKTVVGAEKAGLHQHAMRDTVRIEQPEVLVQRGVVVGRMPARGRQGQAAHEHVGVAVDGGDGGGGHGVVSGGIVVRPRSCGRGRVSEGRRLPGTYLPVVFG